MDCDNHIPPPPGSCQLAWKGTGGAGGTTDLDLTQVTDTGLVATLQGQGQPAGPGYNLKCAEQHTSCALVSGSSGSVKLDLVNIQYRSPSIYSALLNKNSLSCDGTKSPNKKSKSKSKAKKASSKVVVKMDKATLKGKSATILTDTNGMTLYYSTSETLDHLVCTSANGCTNTWTPLLYWDWYSQGQ